MASDPDESLGTIRVRGARTHNLRNVDVDLPLGRLIVMTGVSGSGKSSLAFDTIFAEGQRRYLESVAVHTRKLLRQLPRPDVDDIIGLAPTIALDQRTGSVPARSTLAMLTELHDYLRVLYARAGTAHCTQCGRPVQRQSVDQILSRTVQLPERTRLMILSPMVRGRRGAHREVLDRIARNGFVRARIDGELIDLADTPTLSPAKSHTIEAVVDRIVIKDGIGPRLRESIELACRESDGTCIISHEADGVWSEKLFSTRFSCPDCDLSFATPEPRSFNHNSPWGACAECAGLGESNGVRCTTCDGSRLQPFARRVTFLEVSLTEFLQRSVDAALQLVFQWNADGSAVASPSHDRHSRAGGNPAGLTDDARLVAERILPDLLARLQCLSEIGVGYLTLDRPSRTLSGGESQRARLAAALSSPLVGALFVLDEPTCGLHPRDTERLLDSLRRLRETGSTVIVVEHDGDVMRAADWLVDLGPGAGADGGKLLFSGTPQDAALHALSPTGDYLRGVRSAARQNEGEMGKPAASASPLSESHEELSLRIRNAGLHNLKELTVEIPLHRLVVVSGVSGSGKSSLIIGTLLPIVTAALGELDDVRSTERRSHAARPPGPLPSEAVHCDGVDGIEHLRRIVALDQKSPGSSSRSCIATLCGIWNEVRRIFAGTREARVRGFKSSHFSFNSGAGRCPECRGTGLRNVRMSFLPEAVVPCSVCQGRRFSQAVSSIRFRDLSVADVLQLRVDAATEFFSEFSRLHRVLDTFRRIGLGYLTLGQPASTFSGGESQRAKLACELAVPDSGHTLFILDEPTSGLHPADVACLLSHLRGLVDHGHSVVVIEHNLDVIRHADWILDIGPGSADDGGQLVFAGPPSNLVNCGHSETGRAMQRTA